MGFTIALMVVGISILVWAAVHNLRDRRLAMQRSEQNHVTLTKSGESATEAAAGGGDALPSLRGKLAPAFSLVDLGSGKKVSLAEFRGRPVLVNFWATWCAPCKLEMPWFEELNKKYAAQGFEILGIAEDDAGKDEIAKAVKKIGVTYPILLTDGKVSPAYGGVDYLPMSFYVDRKGVVVVQTAGLSSKDEVEANIRKIVGSVPGAPANGVAAVGGE